MAGSSISMDIAEQPLSLDSGRSKNKNPLEGGSANP